MAKYSDFLVGEDGDIVVRDGDIAMGFGLQNEVIEVMGLSKGELKHDPLLGPNLMRHMKGNTLDQVKRLMELNLRRDGKTVESITIEGGEIKIKATYNE